MMAVLGESVRDLWSRRILALSLLSLSALVCFLVCEFAVTERSTLRSRADGVLLDGWYVISAATTNGEGFSRAEVNEIAQLSGVDWLVAYLPSEDMRMPSGELVPARGAVLSGLDSLLGSRVYWTGPTFSVYAIRRIQAPSALSLTVGSIGSRRLQVVADASAPYAALGVAPGDAVVLYPKNQLPASSFVSLRLGVSSLAEARDLAQRLPKVLARESGRLISVQPDEPAFESQQALLDGLRAESLRRISGFVVIGGILSGIIAGISCRQRAAEFARRRALGCRRSTLLCILSVEASVCFGLGSLLGLSLSVTYLVQRGEALLPHNLTLSIVLMNSSLPALMTLPAFIRVARADPVSVLRVP